MSEVQGYLCIFKVPAGPEDTDEDVDDLKSTFESFGAKVDVIFEPHFDDVKRKIEELSEKDFSLCTYVTIVYLALGQVGVVGTADPDKMIRVEEDIYEPLAANPTLNDQKLLWLIFSDARVHNKLSYDGPQRSSKAVFLSCFGSVEQSSTCDGEKKKSGFLSSLCRILRGKFRTKDVLNIVEEATAEVLNEANESDKKRKKTYVKKNFSIKFYLDGGFKSENNRSDSAEQNSEIAISEMNL